MKKLYKRTVYITAFVICFITLGKIWNYLLVDDTNSYTRIMMHELYEAENIDAIFVGSSHVYRSLIPTITDEELNCVTFNAGSSSQQMDGSFALIKEAAKHHDLKHVYLELYYAVAEAKYSDRTSMTATYILSDYMPFSIDKIKYLLNASDKAYWVNSFIIARRDWNKIFDADYVKNLIKKKNSIAYRNYRLPHEEGEHEYYVERGFVADDTVAEKTDWNDNAYGKINIDQLYDSDWEKSIIEAIAYCKRHDIEITLFIAPEPEWTIAGKGNYQDYHEYIQNLADKEKVEFYDFNLCSNKYLNKNDPTIFKDTDHLNTKGAEVFSHLFGRLCMGKINKNDLFYDTYDEMLQSEEPMVYGLAGPQNHDETGKKSVYIISNREAEIEYKITAAPVEGDQYLIQDFSTNKFFELPSNESGTLTVAWRVSSDPNNVAVIKTEY